MKRGREYRSCGEAYKVEKRESGSNIIFPIILRLLGRISSGEEGMGTDMLGKKIKILKNGCWEEYQVAWNFIHPCPVTPPSTAATSTTWTASPPRYPPPYSYTGSARSPPPPSRSSSSSSCISSTSLDKPFHYSYTI